MTGDSLPRESVADGNVAKDRVTNEERVVDTLVKKGHVAERVTLIL